jgi:uncharacterized protein DUF6496
MSVVTVKVHHPHDGCAEGTPNHVRGNPGMPGGGPIGARMKMPTSSAGVKAPEMMPKAKSPKNPGKVEATMREFKAGALHSGSKKGPKVTSRKQAIAIGLSQARKAGEDVAPAKKKA